MIPFLRQAILAMPGYTPGEQPRDGEYTKLNTNENPYPPSPKVFEAIRQALTGDRLRKYPDPLGHAFRATAGRVLGVDPEAILIGNGSDEILTMVTRAIVPERGLIVSPAPSYLLYRTMAEIQGASYREIPFRGDWQLDAGTIPQGATLTYIPNPNSPSGTMIPPARLANWPTPLVLDEAYVDFAEVNGLHLAGQNDRILVTRSLSKSYSLAGIRFGFAVGSPDIIRQLYKVKDSYNCDVLSLAAATAALDDQEHMLANRAKILATRTRMTASMRKLGFAVTESQANFIWCRRERSVKPLYEELKKRKILVRYMNYVGYGEGLRISVGSDAEIDRLENEMRQLV
jgi:histidinol-phosphate aminotransferase